MIAIRLSGLLSLGMACAFSGLCQSNTPPQFSPNNIAPATVYPDTHITFAKYASDVESYPLLYDLLSGPTNVDFLSMIGSRPPDTLAYITWHTPSRSAVGTTNTFVIRVTDDGNPPLSATSVVNVVLIEPPQISSISLSNKVPVLQFNDLLADKTYQIEWTASLPTTNWTMLAQLDRVDPSPRPPIILIVDTNKVVTQRFYRIIPRSWECYSGCGEGP